LIDLLEGLYERVVVPIAEALYLDLWTDHRAELYGNIVSPYERRDFEYQPQAKNLRKGTEETSVSQHRGYTCLDWVLGAAGNEEYQYEPIHQKIKAHNGDMAWLCHRRQIG
jgi:hypothetical protein